MFISKWKIHFSLKRKVCLLQKNFFLDLFSHNFQNVFKRSNLNHMILSLMISTKINIFYWTTFRYSSTYTMTDDNQNSIQRIQHTFKKVTNVGSRFNGIKSLMVWNQFLELNFYFASRILNCILIEIVEHTLDHF